MKKVFLRIIKEDSSKEDTLQKKKDSMSKLIVAGDSIAVGMSISALKQQGGKSKGFKGDHSNIVPVYPAVRGGMDSTWIKGKILAQLSDKTKDWAGYKLIIIAGTNDAYNSANNPKSKRWSVETALNNISDIAAACKSLGIDFTVMKLAQYEPRGEKSHKKMKPDVKKRHEEYIEKFNSGISSYNNFDMIFPTSEDGLHIYGSGPNTKLLNRALSSLKMKASQVEIPTRNPSVTLTPKTSLSSTDCHVNTNCNCVDRSVSGEITVLGVQRALKMLKVSVEETGACDEQTENAIMNFQKQQQQKGFQPPDGREQLRCDACVGPNTLAAMKLELSQQKKSIEDLTTPEEKAVEKKRRVKILKSKSGTGKTLENIKEDAKMIGCHPDLIVLASVLHSEPTASGRWSDEGYAVFNTLINRIQANGASRGPHSRWETDSAAWNVALNRAPDLGNQSGGWRPFASKNYPRDLRSSVEKVKEFVRKRLSEGSNVGFATFFMHTNAQAGFYKITQQRIKEFGSMDAARAAAKAEHAAAGIKWEGAVKTKWPSYRHPLRRRWRGFGYGDSAENVRRKWTKNYGAAPSIKVSGNTEKEKRDNFRKLKRSTIEVFGSKNNRKNWSRRALADSQIEDYLKDLLKQKQPEEFANV